MCVEEQFYAFWPWLVRALPRSGALLVMLALLVLDVAAERGVFTSMLSAQALRIITSFSAPIGLGAMLALTLDQRRGFDSLFYVLGRPWSAPIALCTAIALLVWQGAPLIVFQASLAALVGACVMRDHHGLRAPLVARPVRYVGRVSYGLYLLNMTAIGMIRRAVPGHAASAGFVFWFSLPVALLLAALSHRYFEAPLLRLRPRFRERAAQRSSTKSA